MTDRPLLIKRVQLGGDLQPAWRHWCPGCKMNHVIYIDPRSQPNGHCWTFDGNEAAPTFSPSINIVGRCHYHVRAGHLDYCSDSAHHLAGVQGVPMVDLHSLQEDWD